MAAVSVKRSIRLYKREGNWEARVGKDFWDCYSGACPVTIPKTSAGRNFCPSSFLVSKEANGDFEKLHLSSSGAPDWCDVVCIDWLTSNLSNKFHSSVNWNRALYICRGQNLNLHGFQESSLRRNSKGILFCFENAMANGRRHLCPFEGKDCADLMELTKEQEYCQPMRIWGKD